VKADNVQEEGHGPGEGTLGEDIPEEGSLAAGIRAEAVRSYKWKVLVCDFM
jgi:hypothetical protein